MGPEEQATAPDDWGSSVLRDLGVAPVPVGPAPAPEPPPIPEPPPTPPPAPDPDPEPLASTAGVPPARDPALAPDPGADGHPAGADLDPERLTRPRHHREPLARQAAHRLRALLGAGTSREVREAYDRAERLRQPVTTIRRLAVLGARGGAGKTTVATMVATALAAARPDRVLAVDAAPDLGSLALRAGAASRGPVAGFAQAAGQPAAFEDTEPHLGRTDAGLWVLAGPASADPAPRLELSTYRAAVAAVARFFAVLVTDCGPDAASPLNQGILEDAHALALVAPATVDGLVGADRTLSRLRRAAPSLRDRTVVVLSSQTPHGGAVDLKRGTRALASQGVRVARLPYDRHLAAGARVRPDLLGDRTTTAVLGLAADLLSLAVSDRGAW
jgi:MinD-like ATPase involved in chromosome partitioning or flagellar assembly